jgi:hypothetical protein
VRSNLAVVGRIADDDDPVLYSRAVACRSRNKRIELLATPFVAGAYTGITVYFSSELAGTSDQTSLSLV